MPFKKQITKEEYDGNEAIQALYIERNGNYVLDIEPDLPVGTVDELGVIKRALAREREDKIAAKIALEQLQATIDASGKSTAIKDKDIEKLTRSHDKDLEKERKKTTSRDRYIEKQLIDAQVNALSSKLALKGHEDVLAPHIRSRLQVNLTGDEPELEIFDDHGRVGLTVEELEKSILDTESFAPILSGSKATGSGASGNQSAGGASTAKKFDEHSGAELVALRRNDPAAYDRLKAARTS